MDGIVEADNAFNEFSVTRCSKKNLDVIEFLRRTLREYPGARVRSDPVEEKIGVRIGVKRDEIVE